MKLFGVAVHIAVDCVSSSLVGFWYHVVSTFYVSSVAEYMLYIQDNAIKMLGSIHDFVVAPAPHSGTLSKNVMVSNFHMPCLTVNTIVELRCNPIKMNKYA